MSVDFLKLRNQVAESIKNVAVYLRKSRGDIDEETMEFKGFLARREYKIITKRLVAGKKIGQRLGRWSNGSAPFGYTYDPVRKSLKINEEEKEIYQKLILDEFLNGKSLHDIAWGLNKKNIPSPRKGKWNPNTISRLLKSEVHLGWVVSNKTEGVRDSQNPTGDKKSFRKLDRDEWVIVKNCHPKLKSEEQHAQILRILKQRTSHCKGGNINALSGMVKCGFCGNTMTIQKVRDKDTGEVEKHVFKKCSNCDNQGGDTELVTYAILTSTEELRGVLEIMDYDISNIEEKQIILNKINDIESEIDENEQALERIEEAFEKGLYDVEKTRKKSKIRNGKILELETERKSLIKKLDNFSMISNEDRIRKLNEFINSIKNNEDSVILNMAYKSIIESITWAKKDNSEVEVIVNFL